MQNAKNQNLSSSLEDYLEAIFNLSNKTEAVRSTDIARALSVAKPSVTGALRALKKKGLINYQPYGCVTLTEPGFKVALRIARKHEIIKSFFVNILGIDEQTAQQAACKAEHAFGPELTRRLLLFVDFLTQGGADGKNVTEKFQMFYRRKLKIISSDKD